MTKAAAIQGFWESFGLAAFEENAVPTGKDAPNFPYITYELITDDFGNNVTMSASLWYRDALDLTWVPANAKADEIGARLGYAGVRLSCDGGCIWLRRGVPFAQSMGDPDDDMICRKVLSVDAMYLTMI